jgi:hypothetical protein
VWAAKQALAHEEERKAKASGASRRSEALQVPPTVHRRKRPRTGDVLRLAGHCGVSDVLGSVARPRSPVYHMCYIGGR